MKFIFSTHICVNNGIENTTSDVTASKYINLAILIDTKNKPFCSLYICLSKAHKKICYNNANNNTHISQSFVIVLYLLPSLMRMGV